MSRSEEGVDAEQRFAAGETGLPDKLVQLKRALRAMGGVGVAYSGGVDSTLLLKVAIDTLGDDVVAVTARSAAHPEHELIESRRMARALGARQVVISFRPFDTPEFARNTPSRCYFCKKVLCDQLGEAARKHGARCLVDGANEDDLDDHRPGAIAARELGVRSPLQEVGMTKEEIRRCSRTLGLPTWDKPSMACLASRIPYGEVITPNKLSRVAAAEDYLRAKGFRQYRVRDHGGLARVELLEGDIERASVEPLRSDLVATLKRLGYEYVTVDLQGFRSGSLNEVL